MERLTDISIMPSGPHKGKLMCEVPRVYLTKFWQQYFDIYRSVKGTKGRIMPNEIAILRYCENNNIS